MILMIALFFKYPQGSEIDAALQSQGDLREYSKNIEKELREVKFSTYAFDDVYELRFHF